MLVALPVVEERALARRVENVLIRERETLGRGRRCGELEDLECRACVATCALREKLERLAGRLDAERRDPAFDDRRRARPRRATVNSIDGAAREERRVDLEVRVLGRRADQRHEAVLDGVQHRVLLRLVEAVDLVDEEDRPDAVPAQAVSGSRDDGAHVVDTRRHGRELLEHGARALRDDPRDRRLPGPGRTEEDHRRRPVLLDRDA